MNTTDLNKAIDEWKDKVLKAKESAGMTDTFTMTKDIDKIIAEAFDRSPVIED